MDNIEIMMDILEHDYLIEFWKSETRERFKKAGLELMDYGFTLEAAAEFLAGLHGVCGNEYGA